LQLPLQVASPKTYEYSLVLYVNVLRERQ